MLRRFGANVATDGSRITVSGPQPLAGTEVVVPGYVSSAAFWLVAGAITPGSDVTVRNVGTSPCTGVLRERIIRARGYDRYRPSK